MEVPFAISRLRDLLKKEEAQQNQIDRLEAAVIHMANRLANFFPTMHNEMTSTMQMLDPTMSGEYAVRKTLSEYEIKDLFDGRGPVATEVSKFLQSQSVFSTGPALPEGFSYSFEGKFNELFFVPLLEESERIKAVPVITKLLRDLSRFYYSTKGCPSSLTCEAGERSNVGITFPLLESKPMLCYHLQAEGQTVYVRDLKFITTDTVRRLQEQARILLKKHGALLDANDEPARDDKLIDELLLALMPRQAFVHSRGRGFFDASLRLSLEEGNPEQRRAVLSSSLVELHLLFDNSGLQTLQLHSRASGCSAFILQDEPHPFEVNYLVKQALEIVQDLERLKPTKKES